MFYSFIQLLIGLCLPIVLLLVYVRVFTLPIIKLQQVPQFYSGSLVLLAFAQFCLGSLVLLASAWVPQFCQPLLGFLGFATLCLGSLVLLAFAWVPWFCQPLLGFLGFVSLCLGSLVLLPFAWFYILDIPWFWLVLLLACFTLFEFHLLGMAFGQTY